MRHRDDTDGTWWVYPIISKHNDSLDRHLALYLYHETGLDHILEPLSACHHFFFTAAGKIAGFYRMPLPFVLLTTDPALHCGLSPPRSRSCFVLPAARHHRLDPPPM
jgi:hypothetical protein